MNCGNCGKPIDFHRTTCLACGHFLGYPNVRKAEAMQADLDRNCTAAVADADARGVRPLLDGLATLLASSSAVVAMPVNVLRAMTLGAAYRSYHRALADDLRGAAEEIYHRHRGVVDEAVHPGYSADITNAAISVDGRGLNNYGEITLRIGDVFIADRATVLRENAFAFYERYDLGRRDAQEVPGWRCVWQRRADLGVAHLTPYLTSATPVTSLPSLVLQSGTGRDNDRFMEVHIFGMVPLAAVEDVSLDRPLVTRDSQDEWNIARQKLAAQGIPVRDRTVP
jgi:hypothetical protein